MARRIQLRRDTAANWSSVNPLLAQGEVGLDLTSGKIKIGDGIRYWNTLSYWDDLITDMSAFQGDIVPSADNTYNLGSPTKQWKHVYVSDGSIYLGDIKLTNDSGTLVVQQVTNPGALNEAPVPNTPGTVTTNQIVNNGHTFAINANGVLTLDGFPYNPTTDLTGYATETWVTNRNYITLAEVPTIPSDVNQLTDIDNLLGGGVTYDQSLNTTNNVTFNRITSTTLAQNSSETVSPNSVNVPGATPTVVFATPGYFTSVKLVIVVEGRLDGDVTNVDHTQTCEATIAATYNTSAEPVMSVYGIIYTSPTPLATFTIARNGQTGDIEVTAVNSQTTNAMNVRVHAIQFVSRYD